jgi:hypothetical protein
MKQRETGENTNEGKNQHERVIQERKKTRRGDSAATVRHERHPRKEEERDNDA